MSGFPVGFLSAVLSGLLSGLATRIAGAAPDATANGPAAGAAAVEHLLRPLVHMLSTDAPSVPATLWLLAACLMAAAAWIMADGLHQRHQGSPTQGRPPCRSSSPRTPVPAQPQRLHPSRSTRPA
ncbi:hypothetical protein [Nitratidesulfovibrio sp.]|uniref:hypothetical protein n=1 Tax=Nitratidesulfovibrio sp. TaxID=2802297 RepID=UPI003341BCA7